MRASQGTGILTFVQNCESGMGRYFVVICSILSMNLYKRAEQELNAIFKLSNVIHVIVKKEGKEWANSREWEGEG